MEGLLRIKLYIWVVQSKDANRSKHESTSFYSYKFMSLQQP